jgi:hypothetical protein
MALFPHYAKRFVTARSRHQVRENAWQNQPEIIWNTAISFGAERAVFEMFFLVREHFLFFAEKFRPREKGAEHEQNHEHNR